jgi:predicted phage terminase large subunit-like protein
VDWLQNVAFTRLTPKGRVLAIATRWSERDPMGWIMQQPGWTILHLPAFAETATDPLGREIGEALWPSHYPVEALEAIRADVGSRVFQTLYQGNVSASQGTIFKRDWFQHYATRPVDFRRVVQSWDTAFKTGATNDYSVCATFGETSSGFYLLALYRAKVEFPELKRQVAQQADLWRPSEIVIEDKASGQSLIQELKLATTYPIVPVKIDRDKETRASAVTGYFECGRVLFPADAPWLADLEDELASFPGGLHDDCVDAISQALNRLRDSGGELTLVTVMKDLSVRGFDKIRSLRLEERLMRRMGLIKGAVNEPAVGTEEPLTPASCPLCGAHRVDFESTGTGPSLKFFCKSCWKYFEGVPRAEQTDDRTKCPKCGLPGQVIASGLRCQNDATQWWPYGPPEVPRVTFKDLKRQEW